MTDRHEYSEETKAAALKYLADRVTKTPDRPALRDDLEQEVRHRCASTGQTYAEARLDVIRGHAPTWTSGCAGPTTRASCARSCATCSASCASFSRRWTDMQSLLA